MGLHFSEGLIKWWLLREQPRNREASMANMSSNIHFYEKVSMDVGKSGDGGLWLDVYEGRGARVTMFFQNYNQIEMALLEALNAVHDLKGGE